MIDESSKILNKILNIVEIAEKHKDTKSFAQSIVDLLSIELHYIMAAFIIKKDGELQLKAITESKDTNLLKLIPTSIFNKKIKIDFKSPKSNVQKSAVNNDIYHSNHLGDFTSPTLPNAAAEEIQKTFGIKSVISIPCSAANNVKAVLLIGKPSTAFSPKEILTLHTFSKQIGYILESREILISSQKEKDSLLDILKNSFSGIIMADTEGMHYVNPRVTQITEYSREELMNMTDLYQLAHPRERDRIATMVRDWIERGEPSKNFETVFISKSREEVFVDVLLSKVLYKNSPMVMATIRDITIHKQNMERLNKINKRQAELFAEIAHSLKTPFTYINGLIELAMPTMKSQSNKDILDQITTEINYASDKISTLLQVAKYELKEHSITKNKIDSKQFIEAAYVKAKSLGYHYCNVNHTHNCDCLTLASNASTSVNLDNQAIMDVIMTIVENAYEHAKVPGRKLKIVMSSKKKHEKLLIEIADNGPGISNYVKSKIFDSFKARVNYNYGHGIGLPMSKKIVEKHGGNIQAESKIGEGSKFIIELPLL